VGGTKLRLDNGCIVGLVADSVEQVQMSDYDTHHMTRVNNDDPFSSTSTSHFVAAANRLLYRLQPRPFPTQDRTQLLSKTVTLGPLNVTVNATVEQEVFRAVQTDAQ